MMGSGAFHSEVAKRISLFEMKESIPIYKQNMTAGKYLVYPNQEPPTGWDTAEYPMKEESK